MTGAVIDPDEPESAYVDLQHGLSLLAAGNAHAATVALERARLAEPAAASVREALARAYYAAVRFGLAAEHFAAALELDPVNDYAHFGLGMSLARSGDIVGARRNLRLAMAMRPDRTEYAEALQALGGC